MKSAFNVVKAFVYFSKNSCVQ